MSQAARLTAQRGELLDRSKPVRFTWNGSNLTGFAGDTIASALSANEVRVISRSMKYHRPRGYLTHSRAMIRIAGVAAVSVLEKVCSVDWSDHMTPDGAVVSASIAKVSCDIIRDDLEGVPSYLVACDRSFGQYLYDALVDAAQEFRLGR